MNFIRAFTEMSEEQKEELNQMIEDNKERRTEELLSMGLTHKEIEQQQEMLIEEYKNAPSYVSMPSLVQYVKAKMEEPI